MRKKIIFGLTLAISMARSAFGGDTVKAEIFRLSIGDLYGKVGAWTVGHNKAGGCLAASIYRDGTTLWFGYDNDGNNLLALNNSRWGSISPGEEYGVKIKFNSSNWDGSFTGYDRDGEKGLIAFHLKPEFVDQIASSTRMGLVFRGSVVTQVSLTGARDSLNMATQCVKNYNERDAEIARARQAEDLARLEAEKINSKNQNAVAAAKDTAVVGLPDGISQDAVITLSKSIGNLEGRVSVLTSVLEEQNILLNDSSAADKEAIKDTISVIKIEISRLNAEASKRTRVFDGYLTSVRPTDRDLYLSARKSSEIYPRVPYYIPGTSETGEFLVEPFISDKGEMNFNFKFLDISSNLDKVRGNITMSLSDIDDAQKSLFKLYEWSKTAHKEQIRTNFEKRVTCFPAAECPSDGERVDGKASTEIRFMVYEDGSTAGRIQRNKGRFVEGYNVSIGSAMLLQAYLAHVVKETKREFKAGTQDKKELDEIFK